MHEVFIKGRTRAFQTAPSNPFECTSTTAQRGRPLRARSIRSATPNRNPVPAVLPETQGPSSTSHNKPLRVMHRPCDGRRTQGRSGGTDRIQVVCSVTDAAEPKTAPSVVNDERGVPLPLTLLNRPSSVNSPTALSKTTTARDFPPPLECCDTQTVHRWLPFRCSIVFTK